MIRYTDTLANITADHLGGFFGDWPDPPSPETHLEVLANSDEVTLAIEDETGNVVGFITAITDGVLSAYIPFLEVLPAYQGQGIGKTLVARMLDKLTRFYMVDLMCDPALQPFYERSGMSAGVGMMLRDRARQSGA